MPYKLSATLTAHSSDVRGVKSPTNELVLSASRDSTAISWQRSLTDPSFAPVTVFKAGSRYINSVAYISPTPDAPKGYVVTGGQDTVINVFRLDANRDDPDFSLLGHADNVCALDVSSGGTIISGSWDRTAKVWKNFGLAYDLKGHEQSVWAVLVVGEDEFLTGSADKSIKLWNQHKCVQTYTGHRDAVRGLALLPDIGFASCSNDSEVRLWTMGGDLVHTLSGHTSFVYSLSVLPSGDIVSAGEDRTVRIWKDGECSQTIVHPAISVWAVSSMPNGDIVSGCSDGVVRVFSEAEERWASAADLKEYEDKVASQALPTQQVGDVKASDLPGVEALSEPGKKSGEVKMVRNGSIVEAHQWDSLAGSWQKIGDVVDAVGSGRKQLYNGKEYDYVFDVDIQDGVPPLKLPFNVTDNPYSAAQKFLETNDLSLNYIDEVVKFIEKNTAGVNIGSNEEYSDPFTGATRYRGASSGNTGGSSGYQDPWTGASRYSGASQPSTGATDASQYVDPFTGGSRYSGASQPAKPAPPKVKVLPATQFFNFKQANVQAMQAKLLQFDDAFRAEITTSNLALFPEETAFIEEVFMYLAEAVAGKQPSLQLDASHVDCIIQIMSRWPPAPRFPLIDMSRLVIGFAPAAISDAAVKEKLLSALFTAAEWSEPWTQPINKGRETNILLLFRTLANIFQAGVALNESWVRKILESLSTSTSAYSALNKTQRVALATVLFNVSCASIAASIPQNYLVQHIALALKALESETADSEAAYRALVALGNIVTAAKTQNIPLDPSQAQDIRGRVIALPQVFAEERVKNVSAEIYGLL